MATFYLINNVRVGTSLRFAGELIDSVNEDTAAVAAAGGVLMPSATNGLAIAAERAQALRRAGAPLGEMAGIMTAALASLGGDLDNAGVVLDAEAQRGTLAMVAGTGTVAAGITVTANSRILVSLKGRPTGSTNYAGVAVTARTAGGPGVGAFTVEFIVAAGTIDADAAGDVDWLILD